MSVAPSRLTTARLILRRPEAGDVDAIFRRYAADPDVTRYLGWPRHRSVDDTRLFLQFSDAEWTARPAGPYLLELADSGKLVGGTGLAFDEDAVASTGYVLARDAWGRGYASEALAAMVDLARQLSVTRLYALCHPAHAASIRVLEKGGFTFAGPMPGRGGFPNLPVDERTDPVCFVRTWP